MLAAAERLRRREEFSATVRGGRRAARGAVVLHLAMPESQAHPNPVRLDGSQPSSRAGFVVSKAVGNAVTRNKVRRRLRHIVRTHLAELPPGADLVVRAMPAAANRTYSELEADLAQALAAARRTGSRR